MPERRADWAVVATVDEPVALVAAFAAHHLALGAAEVHLYLDRTDPEAVALLSGLPGLRLTTCDAAYWAALPRGTRPPRHTARQKANADRAAAQTGCAWLLHCDADEILWPATDDFGAELAAVADRYGWLTLPVAERVAPQPPDIFAGRFRLPLPDPDSVYGPLAGWLNEGLTGHTAGKAAVRTGRAYAMGVHRPVPGSGPEAFVFAPNSRLLHFDGLTPLHLALKLLKRATERVSGPPRPHGAHRIRQFTAMADAAGDPGRWRALVDAWQGLTADQARRLAAAGGLADIAPALAATARVRFPGLDLAPAAFDRALIAREAALIAATGLKL